MDKELHTLIIPDVHGRSFWKEPVKDVLENSDAKIVFLGDYLDPYPYEFEDLNGYRKNAISIFKEILDLKRNNPDRIILLLGNHDCGYAINNTICSCRMDKSNYREISKLFLENENLFNLAYEEYINDEHVIYSHAGIHKAYAEKYFENAIEDNVVELFNKSYTDWDYKIIESLGDYDQYRGSYGCCENGSLIWADLRSWVNGDEEPYGYMVFGHTQLNDSPFITDKYACLDLRRAFYINNDGVIKIFE